MKLNFLQKQVAFIQDSLTRISSLKKVLDEKSDKRTFQNWAEAIDIFAEGLEQCFEIDPNIPTDVFEDFAKNLLLITSKHKYETTKKEGYRRRIKYAANFILSLVNERKLQVLRDSNNQKLDDDDSLIADFMVFSESALDEIWLTPEEDEAWKDL